MIHTYMLDILNCGLNAEDKCHTFHHRINPQFPNVYIHDEVANSAYYTIQVTSDRSMASDIMSIASKVFNTTSDNFRIRIIKRN